MPDPAKYYGEAVNVSQLFIAEVTGDENGAYQAATPYLLAPMSTIAKETTTNTKTRYYSGVPLYVDKSEGETKVTLVIPGLTVKTRAELLGKTYDTTSGLMYDSGKPGEKYFALGYMIEHAGGVNEYAWLLKGKFGIPKEEGETKTDNVNEKTLTVEYTAIATTTQFQLDTNTKSGTKGVYGDQSDTAFKSKYANDEAWFKAVVTPPSVSAS